MFFLNVSESNFLQLSNLADELIKIFDNDKIDLLYLQVSSAGVRMAGYKFNVSPWSLHMRFLKDFSA